MALGETLLQLIDVSLLVKLLSGNWTSSCHKLLREASCIPFLVFERTCFKISISKLFLGSSDAAYELLKHVKWLSWEFYIKLYRVVETLQAYIMSCSALTTKRKFKTPQHHNMTIFFETGHISFPSLDFRLKVTYLSCLRSSAAILVVNLGFCVYNAFKNYVQASNPFFFPLKWVTQKRKRQPGV